jgi:uncharacterized pyridoxamine 5'-phosphate oxidase family protein
MTTDVVDFLAAAHGFALATLDDEGNPRIRFFTTVLEYQGHVVIGTSSDRPVCGELAKNRSVAITALNGTTHDTIRIHGKALPLEDQAAKVLCFEKNPGIEVHFTGPENPEFKLFSLTGEAIIYHMIPAGTQETKIPLN